MDSEDVSIFRRTLDDFFIIGEGVLAFKVNFLVWVILDLTGFHETRDSQDIESSSVIVAAEHLVNGESNHLSGLRFELKGLDGVCVSQNSGVSGATGELGGDLLVSLVGTGSSSVIDLGHLNGTLEINLDPGS